MPPATCANPLLLEWIKEIYDLAKERNSKGVTTYKRAYESMKACPLTFSHPSEAQQLDGIGPKICDRLTEKLKEHCEANGLPAPKKLLGKARKRLSGEDLGEFEEPAPAKKPRKAKPYIPSLRTGPYALILALSSIPEESLQSLTKAQVIELAQPHCESSFTVPSEAGKFYTAWNSMTTLVNKDLVQEKGRPLRKYALTEEGWEVAKRIKAVQGGEIGEKTAERPKDTEADGFTVSFGSTKHIPKSTDGFLDLEDDSDGGHGSMPRPKPLKRPEITYRAKETEPAPSGQRLGGVQVDRYGTLSKTPKLAAAPKNVVELLSTRTRHPNYLLPYPIPHKTPQPPTHPPSHRSTLHAQPSQPSTPSPSPRTFTVHLVLDNREVRSKDDRDYIFTQLSKAGTPPLLRGLSLGDFFWVAKLHDPALLSRYGESGDEVALDWIVERKRLDDLVGSITDGRFQEQKFRLRKSGVRNVVYLIEEFSLSAEKRAKFHEAIQSAIASTQVVNGYFVKRTQKLDDTIRYLARMTRMLKAVYERKTLYLIPTSALTPTTYLPLLTHLRSHADHKDKIYTITYPSFASLASKNDTMTLRDVFLKMLMCTRGISGDKALAIQKVWKTPREFVEAFEACGSQKEREIMVETTLGGIVGRGKVKVVLGAKVAGVWGEA
ncbi:hypothetical protein OEA41_010405 [Lepraria neglecta]|uniref:Crossover junction endonuclease MUS81 n=1 Tax=Lepraria neglecta TaxID=209136 RepID=A0AAE0DHP8_9LECA|nr:hypothetical protein OEA41_010405 [Lepraria neglecta]